MGWKRTPASKIAARMANGTVLYGDEKVVLDLMFDGSETPRTVHFVCLPGVPSDTRYALLGSVDSVGLYFNEGDVKDPVGVSCTSIDPGEGDPRMIPEPNRCDDVVEQPWKQVELDHDMPLGDAEICRGVLESFCDVFAPLNNEPAKVRPFSFSLVKDAHPYRAAYRHFAYDKQKFFAEEIDRWISLNLIERCNNSEWAAAPVIVLKGNRQYRLCYDYGPLNKFTVKNVYPLPDVSGMIDFMSGKKVWSNL